MNTVIKTCIVVCLALVTVACASPARPTSPQSAAIASAEVLNAGGSVNCDPPAWDQVVFSSTELGKVTITNASRCTNTFLFVVFDAIHSNFLQDQGVVAQISGTLAPNTTASLTVAIPDGCGRSYQRDVFFGIGSVTEADLSQFQPLWAAQAGQDVFYAPGVNWKTSPCDATSPPPSPPSVPSPPPFPAFPPSPPSPPSATPPLTACREGILNPTLVINGNEAVATFEVKPGYQIDLTLRTFQKGPTFLPQTLVDDKQGTFGPGVHTLQAHLPGAPDQGDLYCALWPREDLTEANFAAYDSQVLVWVWR